ncbi:MAG: transporter substrate-binding protein [Homoserinimonas sp.]|nr:transporter substrate-binding protein [Homoserinimonas sp.]
MHKRLLSKRIKAISVATVSVGVLLIGSGCAGVSTSGTSAAEGSDYPSRSVELVVPFAAGGGSDLLARLLAEALEEPLGETVVVVNRPGGGGNVGTAEVANSKPDGYTLVMPNATQFTVSTIALPGEDMVGLDELTVVTGLTRENVVLYTRDDSPISSIDDLVEMGKNNEEISYASNGPSSILSLSQVILYGNLGIKAAEVPFGGVGEQIPAVLGGHVDIGAATYSELEPQLVPGGLRILGVFAKERSDYIPDVPTFAEHGLDLDFPITRFIAGPAGMPEDVVAILDAALTEALASDEWAETVKKNRLVRYEVDSETVTADNEESFAAYQEALTAVGWSAAAE